MLIDRHSGDEKHRACGYLSALCVAGHGGTLFPAGLHLPWFGANMVYAGGIIVLYVFSILLTSGQQEQLTKVGRCKTLSALVLSLVGLAVVGGIFWTHGFGQVFLPAPSGRRSTFYERHRGQDDSGDKGGFLDFLL